MLRKVIRQILEDVGYTVITAMHGQQALDRLRTTPTLPCTILLDLNMPIMTGWEFRLYQKQDPALAHIPVVIISADRSIEQQPFGIDAAGYFTKPINYPQLLQTIRDHGCGP